MCMNHCEDNDRNTIKVNRISISKGYKVDWVQKSNKTLDKEDTEQYKRVWTENAIDRRCH